MRTILVKLTTTEGLLGTAPFNEEIYRDFIGSKAPDAASVEEEVARRRKFKVDRLARRLKEAHENE